MDDVSESVPPRPPWWHSNAARVVAGLVAGAVVITIKVVASQAISERVAAGDARADFADYHAGDCVVMPATGAETKADFRHSDCTADPSYTISAVYDSDKPCASDNYSGFDWIVADKTVVRFCLMENLVIDHCYAANPDSRLVELIDCATADSGALKVVRRSEHLDTTACPPGSNALMYLTPHRTYCVAPARAPSW